MKLWKAVLFAFIAAVTSSALAHDQGEQPVAGDRRGNRCFNGSYWKDCGTPDAPKPQLVGAPMQWRYVECYTNECIANALNGLPFERAAEAKLTTWKNYTYVWFRN